MSKKQITVIPATIGLHQKSAFGDPSTRRRVAAYARVSTDSEEQLTSYLNASPYTIGSTDTEIVSIEFASNEDIVVSEVICHTTRG